MSELERPKSWANWRAQLEGATSSYAEEFDLYSDSVVRGVSRVLGPNHLINLTAGERRGLALARPVLSLQVDHYANPNPTDADTEHGGRHPDEIAAILSLALGVRMHAGARSRYFSPSDARGRPRAQPEVQQPFLAAGSWTAIIAHATRIAHLDEVEAPLALLPRLSADDASAFVRAARFYQEAIWISEREPWLSWLLLVSAVEVVAGRFASSSAIAPEALMRELDPALASVCERWGEECVVEVAKKRVHMLGATRKFLDFLVAFNPGAPSKRPSRLLQEWTDAALRKSLKLVYSARSRHLHAGVAIPWQLCMAPTPDGDAPTERHASVDDENVIDEKLPMHLHVFEHLVRGAILRWCEATANRG